ncbi:hypothetical protein ACIO93_17575 [Streptomyces sp. NPDC087903]|uniref:hypothetical protein n=1 Tax=Streptomyces sp. NPDC087903 TaxID=3365819 RepID=UPI003803EE50
MTGMSRRTLLRSMTAGAAAVSAPALLTACSTRSGDSDVSNAGKKLAPWPAYRPSAVVGLYGWGEGEGSVAHAVGANAYGRHSVTPYLELVPHQAASAPSRGPERPLDAPAENPGTPGTTTSARHAESTLRTPPAAAPAGAARLLVTLVVLTADPHVLVTGASAAVGVDGEVEIRFPDGTRETVPRISDGPVSRPGPAPGGTS